MDASRNIQIVDQGGIKAGAALSAVWGELSSGRIGDGREPAAADDAALPLLPADATPRDRNGQYAYVATRDGQALRFPLHRVRRDRVWYVRRERQVDRQRWPPSRMWEDDRVLVVGVHRFGAPDIRIVFIRSYDTNRYSEIAGRQRLLAYLHPTLNTAVIALWCGALVLIPLSLGLYDRPDPRMWLHGVAWVLALAAPLAVASVICGRLYGRARETFHELGGFEEH